MKRELKYSGLPCSSGSNFILLQKNNILYSKLSQMISNRTSNYSTTNHNYLSFIWDDLMRRKISPQSHSCELGFRTNFQHPQSNLSSNRFPFRLFDRLFSCNNRYVFKNFFSFSDQQFKTKIERMQRTMNPMPKHPTYAHRPTPTLQLLSKLSKFQGERKDIVNRAPQEILSTANTSNSPRNVLYLFFFSLKLSNSSFYSINQMIYFVNTKSVEKKEKL